MASVILGYLAAFFSLFSLGPGLGVLFAVALGAGAYGTANSKKWGFWLLAVGSGLRAIFSALLIIVSLPGITNTLFALNLAVFPVALFAAVIHPHSREYMRVWFH